MILANKAEVMHAGIQYVKLAGLILALPVINGITQVLFTPTESENLNFLCHCSTFCF